MNTSESARTRKPPDRLIRIFCYRCFKIMALLVVNSNMKHLVMLVSWFITVMNSYIAACVGVVDANMWLLYMVSVDAWSWDVIFFLFWPFSTSLAMLFRPRETFMLLRIHTYPCRKVYKISTVFWKGLFV